MLKSWRLQCGVARFSAMHSMQSSFFGDALQHRPAKSEVPAFRKSSHLAIAQQTAKACNSNRRYCFGSTQSSKAYRPFLGCTVEISLKISQLQHSIFSQSDLVLSYQGCHLRRMPLCWPSSTKRKTKHNRGKYLAPGHPTLHAQDGRSLSEARCGLWRLWNSDLEYKFDWAYDRKSHILRPVSKDGNLSTLLEFILLWEHSGAAVQTQTVQAASGYGSDDLDAKRRNRLPPSLFMRVLAAFFYVVPWLDILSLGWEYHRRFPTSILFLTTVGERIGALLVLACHALHQVHLLLTGTGMAETCSGYSAMHRGCSSHWQHFDGQEARLEKDMMCGVWCADQLIGVYYSSQFAPLIIFFLLFLSVVKNFRIHHFTRFHCMQASPNVLYSIQMIDCLNTGDVNLDFVLGKGVVSPFAGFSEALCQDPSLCLVTLGCKWQALLIEFAGLLAAEHCAGHCDDAVHTCADLLSRRDQVVASHELVRHVRLQHVHVHHLLLHRLCPPVSLRTQIFGTQQSFPGPDIKQLSCL